MAAPKGNHNHFKHGMRNHRLYGIWKAMRQRCNDCNSSNYKNYGARGVRVCNEWNDFVNFYQWAMSNGYSENLSIDRINVNGNYSPDNCRWVTMKQQQNNRTNNTIITLHGENHTIAEWSDISGISQVTINARIYKYNWDNEKAIFHPLVKGSMKREKL